MFHNIFDLLQWKKDSGSIDCFSDVDYCVLDDEGCPKESKCEKMGPANYACVCRKGYQLVNEECISVIYS